MREGKGDRLLFRGFSRPSARAQRGLQAQGGGDHRLPVCGPEGLLAVHAGAQRGEFMIEEREERCEEEKGTGYFSVGMRERNVVLEWTYE